MQLYFKTIAKSFAVCFYKNKQAIARETGNGLQQKVSFCYWALESFTFIPMAKIRTFL
jgi:hypothetical protein